MKQEEEAEEVVEEIISAVEEDIDQEDELKNYYIDMKSKV